MSRLSVWLSGGIVFLSGCVVEPPQPGAVADHTKYVQGLFDSTEPTVTVPPGTWEVDPLFVRTPNKTIVLADGCRLLAKKGGFQGLNDTLVKVVDGCHDVVIRGEGKAVLEMRLKDYDDPKLYKLGEWRHGLAVWGATNVTVRNLTVLRTGGDGLYVRGAKGLVVEDFVADDGYRLGLGLIAAEDMVVRRSVFKNTHGTPPKCGIDLEPNKETDRLVNIRFEDCVFEGNEASGALFHLCQLSDRTEAVSVVFRNCVSRGNRSAGYQLTTMGDKGVVRGGITFENCRSEDNDVDLTHFNKCESGIKVVEKDCNFAKRTVSKYVKPVGTAPLRFETLKPLDTANPAKPLSTGWLRSPFTFVQWVPKAGKYPIRFRVRQVGPRPPAVNVWLKDRLGTDLGRFTVPPEGREFVLESRGENVYRFEVTPSSGAAEVETPWAGAGLRADFKLHFFTGANRPYLIRVPKDATEVCVNVVPQEACSASLVDASGKTVARKPMDVDKAVLKGVRMPSAADEAWRLVLEKVEEDAFFSIGVPCEPVLWLTEDPAP